MNITRFRGLLHEVKKLGADQAVAKLRRELGTGRADLKPENLVCGKNGLYNIEHNTLSRVILHICDKNIYGRYFPEELRTRIDTHQFDDPRLVKRIHRYHIINCQTLQRAYREGWRDKYKRTQRMDERFFYRFTSFDNVMATNSDQRLLVCGNCLAELNERNQAHPQLSRETFTLKLFFSDKFADAWLKDESAGVDIGSIPSVYGPDWPLIATRYKELVKYQCEGENCESPNLSPRTLRKFLHCHHVNRDKQDTNYSNLKALCILCHAREPGHEQIKSHPDHARYLKLVRKRAETPSRRGHDDQSDRHEIDQS